MDDNESRFELTGDTIPQIANASWEVIEVALWGLSESGNSFLILSTAPDEFLQTSGVPDSLVIEVKREEPDGEHVQYRLCRKGAVKMGQPLSKACVLDMSDALQCFDACYRTREVPRHYELVEWPNPELD